MVVKGLWWSIDHGWFRLLVGCRWMDAGCQNWAALTPAYDPSFDRELLRTVLVSPTYWVCTLQYIMYVAFSAHNIFAHLFSFLLLFSAFTLLQFLGHSWYYLYSTYLLCYLFWISNGSAPCLIPHNSFKVVGHKEIFRSQKEIFLQHYSNTQYRWQFGVVAPGHKILDC